MKLVATLDQVANLRFQLRPVMKPDAQIHEAPCIRDACPVEHSHRPVSQTLGDRLDQAFFVTGISGDHEVKPCGIVVIQLARPDPLQSADRARLEQIGQYGGQKRMPARKVGPP